MRQNTELHVQAGIQKKEIPPLPESYTTLTPVTVMKKDPIIPLMEGSLTSDGRLVKAVIEDEKVAEQCTSDYQCRGPEY